MKLVLNTIGSRYGSIDALNANFEAIQDAFDKTLFRDGTSPNEIEANVDFNSFRILNLPAPVDSTDAVNKAYVDTATALLNSYVDEIAIVAANIADVGIVADNIGFLNTYAEEVATVSNNIDEIVGVANNIGSVQLVGLDLNGAFEQGVIYDFGAITDPAVGAVSPTTSSIVIVADDIASVVSVATNIAAVIGAEASATAAASSAAAASTSASNASTSATNAANSASTATTQVGLATTQAGIATTQATNASTSATTATTKASEASTSATNAATSASGASTSATNASVAQVAAEAALAATLAAYDNFDDRYLGAKASDPSVDNDGNALLGGTLYYNTTSAVMKLYTGSVWVAAYVSGADYLAKANNLSDLVSTTTARTNLGLGTAAVTNSTDYATAAQGAKADSAVQPASLATVATTGAYSDLTGKPTLGSLAALSTVGTTEITNNAVTVDKLAATLDYGSIV